MLNVYESCISYEGEKVFENESREMCVKWIKERSKKVFEENDDENVSKEGFGEDDGEYYNNLEYGWIIEN